VTENNNKPSIGLIFTRGKSETLFWCTTLFLEIDGEKLEIFEDLSEQIFCEQLDIN